MSGHAHSMTQIVTMSATTAAYAAQAVKPSARISGDGPTEEAITLLSARPRDEAIQTHTAIAALRSPTALSLMLMSANGRPPQASRGDVVRRYMEFSSDDQAAMDEPDAGGETETVDE
ncbi:hypothetical protein [Pararhizobium gei]|uniref:hypothetical protein n=1 Tax=Pararhizobium gei TaxID=1395951 RepID=UPI0023DA17E1|nr:hypothetical protein [Rhizobium gei]